MSFRAQFAHPRGLGGRLAGWVMTRRNADRNRWVVRQLDPQPGEHLLEIGCGPGLAVAEVVAAGARVTAVDPSEVMRAMAGRRNAGAVRRGQATILDGTAASLPAGPFDAAYALNTVMFWEDVDATLVGLVDRLRPGGRVAIAVQPRFKGATDADALRLADEHRERLRAAGFVELGVETRALRPVAVGLAAGRRP